jgi:glutamine cyclotransferase
MRIVPAPVLSVVAAVGCFACSGTGRLSDYEVVRQFPHDVGAYTQGLVYEAGEMFESTGRLGSSQLRQVDLATGQVLAAVPLSDDRFGEGLTLLNGKLYQLTWKSGVAYVYEAETLALVDSLTYSGEGWGLATDGTSLIMSNGTATLRYVDPETFAVVREVTVTDKGLPLSQVNELEYINGELYANVYQSDWIVKIDPEGGEVLQWFDLEGLLPVEQRTAATDVLNGIAYDAASGHLLVTGKLWPVLFELRLRNATGETLDVP